MIFCSGLRKLEVELETAVRLRELEVQAVRVTSRQQKVVPSPPHSPLHMVSPSQLIQRVLGSGFDPQCQGILQQETLTQPVHE